MSVFTKDLVERVFATSVQAFLAAFTIGATLPSVGALESAAIAGMAAGLSVVKGALAKFTGTGSASVSSEV